MTSQTVDCSSCHADGNRIQWLIEKYFGMDTFVCAFFIPGGSVGEEPVAKTRAYAKLEAYIKFSLRYGTISRSKTSPIGSADFPGPLNRSELDDPALRAWFN